MADHCLRSREYVNVIVAGKQEQPQWLDMDMAVKHCSAGVGIWGWVSSDQDGAADVVMACAGTSRPSRVVGGRREVLRAAREVSPQPPRASLATPRPLLSRPRAFGSP